MPPFLTLSDFVAEKLRHRVKTNSIEVNGGCAVMAKMVIFAEGASHHRIIQFSYEEFSSS